MLTTKQALDEARRQEKALRTISGWRTILFVLTACFVALAAWGFTAGVIAAGIAGVVLGLAFMVLTMVVHLSIVRGQKNVEAILASLEPGSKALSEG